MDNARLGHADPQIWEKGAKRKKRRRLMQVIFPRKQKE
jgi:hypothetical protein